jgi:hypothetical protein
LKTKSASHLLAYSTFQPWITVFGRGVLREGISETIWALSSIHEASKLFEVWVLEIATLSFVIRSKAESTSDYWAGIFSSLASTWSDVKFIRTHSLHTFSTFAVYFVITNYRLNVQGFKFVLT